MVDPRNRPFRFGVQLSGPADAKDWRDAVRKIIGSLLPLVAEGRLEGAASPAQTHKPKT